MVQDFRTESLPVNFLQKAAFIFLSRIVLRLFTYDQKLEFRKLEATTKKFTKIEADITYLKNSVWLEPAHRVYPGNHLNH